VHRPVGRNRFIAPLWPNPQNTRFVEAASQTAQCASLIAPYTLTKALVEANRANFAINSNVNSGTLVEVAFATARTP